MIHLFQKPKREVRKRTKEEMKKDIYIAINNQLLSDEAKHNIIHAVTWQYTEYEGKYLGARFWTEKALLSYPKEGEQVIHEHVVPRKIIISALRQTKKREEIDYIIDNFLIGAIVHVEEDAILAEFKQTMPNEFYEPDSPLFLNPWARYIKCNIKILDTEYEINIKGKKDISLTSWYDYY